MAVVIEDYAADHSRFHHDMLAGHHLGSDYRYIPKEPTPPHQPRSPASPANYRRAPTEKSSLSKRSWDVAEEAHVDPPNYDSSDRSDVPIVYADTERKRLPSPPNSTSPNTPPARQKAENAKSSPTNRPASEKQAAAAAMPGSNAAPVPQQPPPPVGSPLLPPYNADTFDGTTVVVRDLDHISELAQADVMNKGKGEDKVGILNNPPLQVRRYDISSMPIGDIIEMVGALLTKITSTNDLQHDSLHRNAAHQQTAANHNNDGASMSPLSSSVLAFHGKNVPGITINSYLARIHKYCPTTYEVFLSLLVYFDRMTERVNQMVMEAEEAATQKVPSPPPAAASPSMPHGQADTVMEDEYSDGSDGTDSDDDDTKSARKSQTANQTAAAAPSSATYFVVDSFNIHRLIIAGVTCASKFFSDVFYTNSRYAKVGGLPLGELNHLELQFLLLNDFRLAVPVEDLDAYATMLVEFYARDMVENSEEE